MFGCGEIPPGVTVDGLTSGKCDPALVGGNAKCSPRPDGTADTVECSTYSYLPDGTWVGQNPVAGCTLDFVASPGVPYTAICVASCGQ